METLNNNTASTASNTATTTMIQEMDEIITHELIHIYDVRQLHLNLVKCHDLAYSEIRAAREAECSRYNPVINHSPPPPPPPDPTSPRLQHQYQHFHDCVRTRATTATKNIFPSFRAHQCIRNVYTAAMADVRPLVPNDNSASTTATATPPNPSLTSHEDSYVSKQ